MDFFLATWLYGRDLRLSQNPLRRGLIAPKKVELIFLTLACPKRVANGGCPRENGIAVSGVNILDIHIVIPTYNEAARIGPLVAHLRRYAEAPVTVVNSPRTTDDTATQAAQAGAQVLACPQAGRAVQMNYGAAATQSEWLYFVHADTLPPASFLTDIAQAAAEGYDFGYFSYRFDSTRWLLRVNGRATRYDGVFSGGGDQTLFIRRSTFDALGGFDERLHIMEDFEFVKRAKRAGYQHLLITNDATTSARKYAVNSWLRVNLVNLAVFVGFHIGVPTAKMSHYYRRWLRNT